MSTDSRGPGPPDAAAGGREGMLADIRSEVTLTRHATGKDVLNARVMSAMATVPRDAFVPRALRHSAYANGPLPIGHGQTISQPFIVALMTELITPLPDHRVLEIGTGSGYQTAVLSHLCQTVYSIERVGSLSTAATRRLADLQFLNVETMVGNGYLGWPEQAPFDGIIVTAAASHVPAALVAQLKPGGRMAIPVGSPYGPQELMLVEKDENGRVTQHEILAVAFVPMVNQNGSTPTR